MQPSPSSWRPSTPRMVQNIRRITLHAAGQPVNLHALGFAIEYESSCESGGWQQEVRTPRGPVLPATFQVHFALAGWMALYKESGDLKWRC